MINIHLSPNQRFERSEIKFYISWQLLYSMYKVVLLRHGESTWNLENKFTGWTDVGLSENGVREAHAAAKLLMDGGYKFDIAYTSVLKRAIKTLWMVLEDMDLM